MMEVVSPCNQLFISQSKKKKMMRISSSKFTSSRSSRSSLKNSEDSYILPAKELEVKSSISKMIPSIPHVFAYEKNQGSSQNFC
jgi:hypothetical protein